MTIQNGPIPDFLESIEIMAETAKAFRPNAKRIFDMGCGHGYMAKALMKLYPGAHFSILDIHPTLLKLTGKMTKGLTTQSPEFIQADILDVKLPKSSYNVITAMHSFWFLNDIERVIVLRKLKDSLAPRGCLLVGVQVGEDHPLVANVVKERIKKEAQAIFETERTDALTELYTKTVQYYPSASIMRDLLIYAGFTAEVILIHKRQASAVFLAVKP
jgi:trans-aconitate methyltransferase